MMGIETKDGICNDNNTKTTGAQEKQPGTNRQLQITPSLTLYPEAPFCHSGLENPHQPETQSVTSASRTIPKVAFGCFRTPLKGITTNFAKGNTATLILF